MTDAPRWLLLAALVYAPWAYGCTRPWAGNMLAVILGVVVLLWLVDCMARGKWSAIPRLLLVAVFGLLAQGWWMALNAKSSFDPDHLVLIPNASLLSNRPGSVDGNLSVASMFIISSILGAMLFIIDLVTRPLWRKRLLVTMACTGVSIAFFGIIQKIGGESILAWTWEQEKIDLNNNFALYRYRGNAAAFLNLVAPIIFGVSVEAFRKRDSHWPRAACAAALIVIVAAIELNPSRAGWGIALLMALAIGVAFCGKLFQRAELQRADFWRWCVLGAVFIAGLAAICWLGGWQTSWSRMLAHGIDPSNRSPTEIYRAMIPDAGLFGFGPGTFRAIFPSYQLTYDFGGRTVPEFWTANTWSHAHNDYLQTLIEWGYLGTFFWALLFLGGFWNAVGGTVRCAVRRAAADPPLNGGRPGMRSEIREECSSPSPLEERAGERRRFWPVAGNGSRAHRLAIACSLLALAGVLVHASIDFPLQIPSLQFYVAVLLALCWTRLNKAKSLAA